MNGNNCVLDTGVIIDYFKGEGGKALQCLESLESSGAVFYASEITVMELLSFPGITPKEEREIKLFLEGVNIQPMNSEIREYTIALRRRTRRKLPDAIIGATAICLHSTLVTGDKTLCATIFPGLRTASPDAIVEKGASAL